MKCQYRRKNDYTPWDLEFSPNFQPNPHCKFSLWKRCEVHVVPFCGQDFNRKCLCPRQSGEGQWQTTILREIGGDFNHPNLRLFLVLPECFTFFLRGFSWVKAPNTHCTEIYFIIFETQNIKFVLPSVPCNKVWWGDVSVLTGFGGLVGILILFLFILTLLRAAAKKRRERKGYEEASGLAIRRAGT
jgi:hypothetical protein